MLRDERAVLPLGLLGTGRLRRFFGGGRGGGGALKRVSGQNRFVLSKPHARRSRETNGDRLARGSGAHSRFAFRGRGAVCGNKAPQVEHAVKEGSGSSA